MTASLVIVPTELVEGVWFKAIPHLKRGEKYWERYFTLNQSLELLRTGRQQLWLMIDGKDVLYTLITQIDDYPNVRSLRICYFGGEGLNVAYMGQFKKVETWAKEHGCAMIEFAGREEWERLLNRMFGYHTQGKVYRKELK